MGTCHTTTQVVLELIEYEMRQMDCCAPDQENDDKQDVDEELLQEETKETEEVQEASSTYYEHPSSMMTRDTWTDFHDPFPVLPTQVWMRQRS